MGSIEKPQDTDFDVLIVGAGISGINSGYRIQTEFPSYKYTIIEARGNLGGTWDLFRYPGIRSDSDLHTFGFSWRPWQSPNSIAEGDKIREYMRESAAMYGIDKKIEYHHKLISSDWSSKDQVWTHTIEADGEKKTYTARFTIFGTGYYNYDTPLEAKIPGLDRFKGQTVHPQFWPEDMQYKGRKFAVVGSGATAITLIPNLVKEGAEKVTMVQRSPTYIVSLPQRDPSGDFIRKFFPSWLAHRIVRLKFLILPFLFFKFCRSFPNAAKKGLRKNTEKQIPDNVPMDPNFTPKYNPWDQRLCVCPDGDFYKSLADGKATVVTDHIETVTETGIITKGGKTVEADVIVTATGLKMQMAGGAKLSVDGKPINFSEKFLWKGVMLQDVPNACVVIGYTNASWTLGADTTAELVCRLLRHMDANGQSSAVARVDTGRKMKPQSVLNLSSTYIVKAKGALPMAGDQAPWLPRDNYLTDYPKAVYGSLTNGLEFSRAEQKRVY